MGDGASTSIGNRAHPVALRGRLGWSMGSWGGGDVSPYHHHARKNVTSAPPNQTDNRSRGLSKVNRAMKVGRNEVGQPYRNIRPSGGSPISICPTVSTS